MIISNKSAVLVNTPTALPRREWLTWRVFWVESCAEVVGRTLYRLQPLVAAYAGSLLRCWRDKHSPHCWKTDRVSQLSRCWRRGISEGPGNQRKTCWGSHGQWLLQCCDSRLGAGQKGGRSHGSRLQTWHFPGAASLKLRCHTAPIPSLLLWCSLAGTGEPQLQRKYKKIFSTLEKFIYSWLVFSGTYSQVCKYWDFDTILIFLAQYTTTMDLKWDVQEVL